MRTLLSISILSVLTTSSSWSPAVQAEITTVGTSPVITGITSTLLSDVSEEEVVNQIPSTLNYRVEEMTAADFNRDGFEDIVSVGRTASHVYLNDGLNNFSTVVLNTVSDISSHAVADFNGDANLDVYISYRNEAHRLYLGDGVGGFNLNETFANSPDTNESLAMDFDGDGDIDIFNTNAGTGQTSEFLLNDGNANFTVSPFAADTNTFYATSGDYNSDGFPDLVTGTSGSNNNLYLTTGPLTFAPAQSIFFGTHGYETGDLNGDGHLDVYGKGFIPVQNYLNFGDGTGGFTQSTIDQDLSWTIQSLLQDIDLDGDVDIFNANFSTRTDVWLNDGTGTFTRDADYGVGRQAYDVAAGDFDHDGRFDVLYGLNQPSSAAFEMDASYLITRASVPAGTTTIGTVDLSSSIPGQFSVSGTDAGSFSIDSTSGELAFSSPVTYDVGKQTYTVNVRFTTAAGQSTQKQYVFRVLDTPLPGTFSYTQNATRISETGSGNWRQVLVNVEPNPDAVVNLRLTTDNPDVLKICAGGLGNTGSCNTLVDSETLSFPRDYLTNGFPLGKALYVYAVDNEIDERGNYLESLTLSVDAASSDAAWAQTPDQTVTFEVQNDDEAVFAVTPVDSFELAEGESADFTVSLQNPPAADVIIDVNPVDANLLAASPSQLTYTPGSWQDAQTVTITALPDDDTTDEQSVSTLFTLNASSPDTGYADAPAVVRAVTITDPDVLTLVPDDITLTLAEGATLNTSFTLSHQPTASITLTFAPDDGQVTLSPATLTFTPDNWNTPQTIELTAAADADLLNNNLSLVVTGLPEGVTIPVVVTDTSADADADNTSDDFEDAGPNFGDGNGDGILDSLQSAVGRFPVLAGAPEVVVDTSAECTLRDTLRLSNPDILATDPEYDYPYGFFSFEAVCAQATVELFIYADGTEGVLRKYTDEFDSVPDATVESIVINDRPVTKVSYTVRDGDMLDESPPGDGIIRDPVGLGILKSSQSERQNPVQTPVVSAPTLIRTGGF